MRGVFAILALCSSIPAGLLNLISFAQAQEAPCGIVHQRTRDPLDGQRFWLLAEYDGRAFLDQRTCLVVSTEVFEQQVTLSEAMEHCSMLGQGGPHGDMGWQLPTVAELTSLDSDRWSQQAGEFGDYKIPPMTRSETAFWTRTEWPSKENSYGIVIFSAPTTLVRSHDETEKAGVWCVQGFRATGLK